MAPTMREQQPPWDNNITDMNMDEIKRATHPRMADICKKPAVENPFKSYMTVSFWRKVKIALLFFIVPLRLVLMVISLLTSILWSTFFLIGYTEPDPHEPYNWFRRIGVRGMYAMARANCFICGFHRIVVRGKVDPAARIAIVAPHSCAMDTWIVSSVLEFNPVARGEFIGTPLMGNCFRMIQPIYVHRADKNSKASVLKEIIRRVTTPGWPAVLIYPEGTCTNRTALTSFKPGAFAAGVPVQPIMVRYSDCADPHGFDYASWGFVGTHFLKVVLLMATNIHNNVEIDVLPMYTPSEEEVADPLKYARNVRSLMAESYGVPMTEHSYEDCRLMMAAARCGLPMESGVVEYHRVNALTGLNYDAMVERLGVFAKIDGKHDGVVDFEEFCEYLSLSSTCEEAKKLFEIYDVDSDGVVDFREYILGWFFLSQRFNTDENVRLVFDILREGQNGESTITLRSVTKALQPLVENVGAVFEEMDADSVGNVDVGKLKVWLEKKPEYFMLFFHIRNVSKNL